MGKLASTINYNHQSEWIPVRIGVTQMVTQLAYIGDGYGVIFK